MLTTLQALEWADPGGCIDEEAGAQGHLPGRQVIVAQHAAQDVIHQPVMAAAHGVLYERAGVRLTLVVPNLHLRSGSTVMQDLTQRKL